VVPAPLRGPLLQTVRETGSTPPVIDQLVLADLLSRGSYDRHVRRARLAYRRRRHELAERLAMVTDTPLTGVAAGLHTLLPVASEAAERELVATAERAGLLLQGLHTADYWYPMDEERPAALCGAKTRILLLNWALARQSGCSAVLADQFCGGPSTVDPGARPCRSPGWDRATAGGANGLDAGDDG
jgi:DNA-binding transcriptional MocR family regulator